MALTNVPYLLVVAFTLIASPLVLVLLCRLIEACALVVHQRMFAHCRAVLLQTHGSNRKAKEHGCDWD